MDRSLRTVLVTPISPSEPGNGLASRARAWETVLAGLGPSETVLLPVAGDAWPADALVAPLVHPGPGTEHLPWRARRGPEATGRVFGSGHGPYDLVLALRCYTGPFALGLAAKSSAVVVVDLDDDDADLLTALGEYDEAKRSASLVQELSRRADLLVSVTGFAGTAAVPNSVERPAALHRPSRPGPPRVLMVGNFGYRPNVEGARWFLDEVLPKVRVAVPEVEVALVGPGSEALGPHGRGYVADLSAEYARATVAVVPLMQGSGSRIKAIEAFAHRVPVVGTSAGLAGLDVSDGQDCLIRDESASFGDAVVSVLTDHALAEHLAGRAQADLAPRYDRNIVAAEAAHLLRRVVMEGPSTRYERAQGTTATETPEGLIVMDEVSLTAHQLGPFAAAVLVLAEDGAEHTAIQSEAVALFADQPTAAVVAAVNETLLTLEGSGLVVRRSRAAEGE